MNRTEIDLVDRLRIAWTSCHDRINEERAQAADEIERLRAGGCARDQKTTQFCREALDLQAELATCRIAYEQAVRDRDAARLAYCRDVWQGFGDEDEQRRLTPREIARDKGWPWPIAGSEAAT